eukprot:5852183-Pleurochrysis_carterae.AAC.1
MLACAKKCDYASTAADCTSRSHMPFQGIVRPCDCCEFGRSADPNGESNAFQKRLEELGEDQSEKGKQRLSTVISNHKRQHRGTPPGPTGAPFTSASLW